MGRKTRNSVKATAKPVKPQVTDASNLKISELCLEEFEKSLATMLESLSSKKIEVLQTCAYNSKNDPTTVIGKISAKYLLDDDESIESLQQKIITAANLNAYLDTKFITVKSTTSSDTNNSSQDEKSKKDQQQKQMQESPIKALQDRAEIQKPRRIVYSESQQRKHQKQSLTPPSRGLVRFSELKKCLSDGRKRASYGYSESSSFTQEHEEEVRTTRKTKESASTSHIQSYRELIENKPNIYVKADKHFIIDELSLESILQKVYFEGYTYQNLKEYVPAALRKITSLDEFLDILYNSIREYSLRVREHIMDVLDEVIIGNKRLVTNANGQPELVNEFGGYKKFSKHCMTYTGLINKIYEAHKSLEMMNIEIEKICSIYIDQYCRESVRFSCADFHKRVFAKYFYNYPWIKDFLETISRYFEERHFYALKYPTAVSQIIELIDCLNKLQQYDADSHLIESIDENGYEQPCGVEEDEVSQDMDNERVRVSLTVREELLQKMIHKDLADIEDDQKELTCTDEPQAANTKSKKKKNKKKKNKNSANKDTEDMTTHEATPSSDKIAENLKENENVPPKPGKKRDYLNGLLKQNTGNVKLDNEVEEFEKRLDLDIDESKRVQEKIKPNISDEWLHSLRQRLNKINKIF